MRRVLICTLFLLVGCFGKEKNSNELTNLQPVLNLDSNLRKALLKALTELENEENERDFKDGSDKIITRAQASAVSYIETEDGEQEQEEEKDAVVTTEKIEDVVTTTEKTEVLVQRSKDLPSNVITTFEHSDVDPVVDAEQILTSASSSIILNNGKVLHEKRQESSLLKNKIPSEKASVATTPIVTSTTPLPTSTEESEAKVEDVQFYNAPLVAAFTVHQDERGLPKLVEPIYKNQKSINRNPTNAELKIIQQTQIREDELRGRQLAEQQNLRQFDLQRKQKALEEEIERLKLIQQQQVLYLRQQYQKEKLLEEEFRLRNAGRSLNNNKNQVSNNINTIQTQTEKNTLTPTPLFANKNQNPAVSVHPSIEFNPSPKTDRLQQNPSIGFNALTEAGRLPQNGQVLPIKNANNFHLPLVQSPNFLQFPSLPLQNVQPIRNFQPLIFDNIPQISFTTPLTPNLRVFRQESHAGNFLNQNNQNLNSIGSSFTIQKSIQPQSQQQQQLQQQQSQQQNLQQQLNQQLQQQLNQQQDNRFRSNFQSFNNPNSFNIVQSTQPFIPVNNFNTQPIQQQHRFFRSNLEGTHASPNSFNQQAVDRHLHNLLYNSGIIRGNEQEHLGIISKVLTLNHNGVHAAQKRVNNQGI
ncbi:unnamed protein product [Brassicogethes aeneus]|uniref:Uncharacterized protein n=1 Tax=Brassicogethes aeneus TaxID=1431903 RepID=A0A9P0B1C0_BRAAE|nr:unnamed protein product [Brassicogethes aeneus]